MSQLNKDFQKQNVRFDISKLRQACDDVLKIKGFDTSLGIPHFAGISLNQIPGDPDSIKGNKVRGVYWTKPDSSGKEVVRDVTIDESEYTHVYINYIAVQCINRGTYNTAVFVHTWKCPKRDCL